MMKFSFDYYVNKVLEADEKDPEPTCPYPANNGECYVDRRDPEHGCLNCEWAEKSYETLDEEQIRKIFAPEIEEMADHLMTERKAECKGVRVFCARCGSYGKHTPFRKYNNFYLCEPCYKIVLAEKGESHAETKT